MDPAKVQPISAGRTKKVKDIQSFLGSLTSYRWLSPTTPANCVPLTRLTRKGVKWNFSDRPEKSFETLELAFTPLPFLLIGF